MFSVHIWKKCEIFQGRSNVIVRSCSQFEVWSGSPSAASPTPTASPPPSVLLFGFAGSKKHQLEKHSKLYNELGYHTLYCILPLQHLFHYDIHRIRCLVKTKYPLYSKSLQGLCQLGFGRCHEGKDGKGGLSRLLQQWGGALPAVHPCSCSARRCKHSWLFLPLQLFLL